MYLHACLPERQRVSPTVLQIQKILLKYLWSDRLCLFSQTVSFYCSLFLPISLKWKEVENERKLNTKTYSQTEIAIGRTSHKKTRRGKERILRIGCRNQDYELPVFQISSRSLRAAVYFCPAFLIPDATCCRHWSVPHRTHLIGLLLTLLLSPLFLSHLYTLLLFFLPISSYPDHTPYVPEAPGASLDLQSILLHVMITAGTNILGFHTGHAWNRPYCLTAVSSLHKPDKSL